MKSRTKMLLSFTTFLNQRESMFTLLKLKHTSGNVEELIEETF